MNSSFIRVGRAEDIAEGGGVPVIYEFAGTYYPSTQCTPTVTIDPPQAPFVHVRIDSICH